MFSESFKQEFKRLVGVHGVDRVFMAQGRLAGEEVGILHPNGHPFKTLTMSTFTDGGPPRPSRAVGGVRLTDEERAVVLRIGLDPDAMERREKSRTGGGA